MVVFFRSIFVSGIYIQYRMDLNIKLNIRQDLFLFDILFKFVSVLYIENRIDFNIKLNIEQDLFSV